METNEDREAHIADDEYQREKDREQELMILLKDKYGMTVQIHGRYAFKVFSKGTEPDDTCFVFCDGSHEETGDRAREFCMRLRKAGIVI